MHCMYSLETSCPPTIGLKSRWKMSIFLVRLCIYAYKYRKACHVSFELGLTGQILNMNPHRLIVASITPLRLFHCVDAARLSLYHFMIIYGTIIFPCFLVIGLKDDLPYMDADMAANLVASCQGASDADVADYLLVSAPIRDSYSWCSRGWFGLLWPAGDQIFVQP